MPLKISHRKEAEVPRPTATGRINENLEAIKAEMLKIGEGMVLEIETGSETAVRGTKALITRASNELGAKWRHWSQGTKVFARPSESVPHRRYRRSKPTP